LSEDSAVVIPDGATPRKAVDTLKGQNLLGEAADVKGDLFEILVNDLGSQKKAAQFRTPPCGLPVKRGMGDRLKPSQWKFLQSGTIHIFEADKDIIRMAAMNSVLHGFDQSPIVPCDSIGGDEDKWDEVQFDCILENPPFSGTVQSPNGVVNRATQAERFSQGTSGKKRGAERPQLGEVALGGALKLPDRIGVVIRRGENIIQPLIACDGRCGTDNRDALAMKVHLWKDSRWNYGLSRQQVAKTKLAWSISSRWRFQQSNHFCEPVVS
jgi:hypothetical protein